MIIAIDFDGTITSTHTYPGIEGLNPKAVEVIKKLMKKHTCCLWTCREGQPLLDAVQVCRQEGLEFKYINNSPYKTLSRKIAADIYIDDRSFGGIDWDKIEEELC